MFIVGCESHDNVVVNSAQVVLFEATDYAVHARLSDGRLVCLADYPSTLACEVAFSELIDALSENAVMLYYMPSVCEIWEVIHRANSSEN